MYFHELRPKTWIQREDEFYFVDQVDEGQVVQIVDVKNNIYYIDLNGERLRTTSMDLQKINY